MELNQGVDCVQQILILAGNPVFVEHSNNQTKSESELSLTNSYFDCIC